MTRASAAAPVPAGDKGSAVPLRAPSAVASFDLDRPPAALVFGPSASGAPYTAALVLVRRGERPLGTVTVPVQDGAVPAATILDAAGDLAGAAGPPDRPPRNVADVTVVITTCADAARVSRCLDGLAANGSGFETVVVENRPSGSPVSALLAARDDGTRYVEEPHPGLSRARNAGLHAASRPLVAFVDDDLVLEPGWLQAVAGAFADPSVACVTGLILPLELETPEQVLFEQFAGFGKGFERRRFALDEPPPGDPLFPYSPGSFGSGANTALLADVARALGGFDEALGVGTPGRGGEELDLYLRLLLAGHAIAYEPAALVWHQHPRGRTRLRRQAFNYGIGLSAVLTKHLLFDPRRGELLRRVPAGLRHLVDPASRKNAGKDADYPPALDRLERLGMIAGPAAYLRSLQVARTSRVRAH